MTKYVVSGYIGFNNFGDEAIALVLSEKLKSKSAKVTFISSNPEQTSKDYGVDSCGMFGFLKPLAESDVLISGGGSLLQDVTSFKSLIYYLGVIYSALIFNKKVEIFAQGIGPINSKIGQILTKFALKRASKISVRDKKSLELLESWGIQAELVKDPIFDIEIPKTEKTNSVCVQLRDFKGVDDAFLHRLAEKIKEQHSDKEIYVLSLQDKIDLEVCKKFSCILNNSGLKSSVINGLGINETIDFISKQEYLVAMRFHSIVIGIKSGAKILAINYDPKVEKLAKEYNLPFIELNQDDISKEFETIK